MKKNYLSLVMAAVIGLTTINGNGFYTWAETKTPEYNLGSPSDALDGNNEISTPSDAIRDDLPPVKGRSAMHDYQIYDIGIESAEIHTGGNYIIRQSTEETYNSINVYKSCDLWLDGLNGNINIEVGESVEEVRIHLLSDCMIRQLGSYDNPGTKFIIDSKDPEGIDSSTKALRAADGSLDLPGGSKVEINNVDVQCGLVSTGSWDDGTSVGRITACNLSVTGGSLTGKILFNKNKVINADVEQKVPDGTIYLKDTVVKLWDIKGEEVKIENCTISCDEALASGSLVSINAPKLMVNNSQWFVENLEFEADGEMKDCSFAGETLTMMNCNLSIADSQIDSEVIRIIANSENRENDIYNVKWKNCTINAETI